MPWDFIPRIMIHRTLADDAQSQGNSIAVDLCLGIEWTLYCPSPETPSSTCNAEGSMTTSAPRIELWACVRYEMGDAERRISIVWLEDHEYSRYRRVHYRATESVKAEPRGTQSHVKSPRNFTDIIINLESIHLYSALVHIMASRKSLHHFFGLVF